MHIESTILAAAALSAGVAADFLIITDYPQALQTLNPQQVYFLHDIIKASQI
jgi:hypothetical protein